MQKEKKRKHDEKSENLYKILRINKIELGLKSYHRLW